MVTLLLGFFALWAMKECKHILLKLLVLIPFVLAADLLRTDYGGAGVLLIAMFGLSRKFPYKRWVQTLCMLLICWYMDSAWIIIGGIRVPVQMFAVLSMIPICLYSGRKVTNDKKVQWAFYLFYPVHLAFLWIIA